MPVSASDSPIDTAVTGSVAIVPCCYNPANQFKPECPMSEPTIRPLSEGDHADWKRLWTDYLTFYEASVPESVYASTWKRLFAPGEFEPRGFIATIDGKAVGLVHYLDHRSCWSEVNNCYLQDLFSDPDARGNGVGAALIRP